MTKKNRNYLRNMLLRTEKTLFHKKPKTNVKKKKKHHLTNSPAFLNLDRALTAQSD